MKVALDSNVLVYAMDDRDPARQSRAIAIVERCASLDLVLANQVIGEVIAVIGRKRPEQLAPALAQVCQLIDLFPPVLTETRHLISAAEIAQRHKLQYWDALIWRVAVDAGARWFLSEDMHDGLTIDGMTVINPFAAKNFERVDAILDRQDPITPAS